MQATIEPGSIAGIVNAPPSKSASQRAFAAALLREGKTIISNAGTSDDELAALDIIQRLGAKVVSQKDNAIEIESGGVSPNTDIINCGESGLSARLFTPIAALGTDAVTVTGGGSLMQRPMKFFGEVLPELHVVLSAFNGKLPVTVQGPLQAKSIKINGSEGSQFLSGLLFACCAAAREPLTIEVEHLKSKPYIDMTLEVLQHFGWPVAHSDHKTFYIDPALFVHADAVTMSVEADWSSAAGLLIAGAIAGEMSVRNLRADSKQADVAVLDVLRSAGAEVAISDDVISVKRAPLRAFEFDATHCPDLFPVLAILAACCNGEGYITGVHRLFHKESNRAESITEMLENFAVPFSIEDDALCITGVRKLQGTVIDAYSDHRIVMAAAIGALRANGPVTIDHAESVNKSYPGFFGDLISCGARCNFSSD